MAGFTVWGRRENSPQFDAVSYVNEKLGLDSSNGRRDFHLQDRESTRELALSAGFDEVFCWYTV
mgnify:CR=1 FL=1